MNKKTLDNCNSMFELRNKLVGMISKLEDGENLSDNDQRILSKVIDIVFMYIKKRISIEFDTDLMHKHDTLNNLSSIKNYITKKNVNSLNEIIEIINKDGNEIYNYILFK